jgi:hypothetical protein
VQYSADPFASEHSNGLFPYELIEALLCQTLNGRNADLPDPACGTSLVWNLVDARLHTPALAERESLVTFNKDRAFRLWAARHGGIYRSGYEERDAPQSNGNTKPETGAPEQAFHRRELKMVASKERIRVLDRMESAPRTRRSSGGTYDPG